MPDGSSPRDARGSWLVNKSRKVVPVAVASERVALLNVPVYFRDEFF